MNLSTVAFINEIKNYPALWDMSSNAYGIRSQRAKAWEIVCTKNSKNFKSMSAAQQKMIVTQFQRKWKSLRDSFSRELIRIRRDRISGNTKKSDRRQYVFFDNLKFLIPKGIKRANNKAEKDLIDIIDTSTETIEEQPQNITCLKFRQVCRPSEKTVTKNSFTDTNEDEDRMFLLSLVPELKRIPESYRLEVKSDILNVIRKARSLYDPIRTDNSNLPSCHCSSTSNVSLTIDSQCYDSTNTDVEIKFDPSNLGSSNSENFFDSIHQPL